MLKEALGKAPTWAVLLVLAVSLPVAGWTVRDHMDVDKKQSASISQNHEDIRDLTALVNNLAQVVEYNYRETESNSLKVEEIQSTQKRLELILARIETRLDRTIQ